MRKVLLAFAAVMMVMAYGMATQAVAAKKAPKAETMTMSGYIIDTKCATDNKDKLDEFVKSHTKECATAPACQKSGYNFYSEGKLYKLDKASNKKAIDFLKKADSKLNVKVEMSHGKGDVIKLMKIENAE